MGNGHSGPADSVRSSKSRQSTRSLPDSSRFKKERALPTESVRPSDGVYTGAPPSTLWSKDAAPYYCPSTARSHSGPRSLDLNKDLAVTGHTRYPSSRSAYNFSNENDGWSDVASDMYRIRAKSKREKKKAKTAKRREEELVDVLETQSEVFPPLHRAQGRGRSSSSRPETRNPSFAYNAREEHPGQLMVSSADLGEGRESLSLPRPKPRIRDLMESQPKPPPRPKKNFGGEVPGEKWVDFPPEKNKEPRTPICERPEPRVSFSKSSMEELKRSPRKDLANQTPPRSPGSSECDRLIIQSLKVEVTEERSRRSELEKKNASLEEKVSELQTAKRELDAKASRQSLEDEIKRLNGIIQSLKKKEEVVTREKETAIREKREQQGLYDEYLDNIASRVATALVQQKNLREDCAGLRQRGLELEWDNKLLRAQLRLLGAASGLPPSNAFLPLPHKTTNTISQLKLNRQSMGSDPTLPLAADGAGGKELGLTSIASVQMEQAMEKDSMSPLSNAGEGLCSRPQSFYLDPASVSFQQLSTGAKVLVQQVEERRSASEESVKRGAVLTARVNPIEKLRELESEDLYGADETRNFAQRLGDAESLCSAVSSLSLVSSLDNPLEDGIKKQPKNLDISEIEKMRSGSWEWSLDVAVFSRSLLLTDKTLVSTPKETSPQKSLPSVASEDGTLTPTADGVVVPLPLKQERSDSAPVCGRRRLRRSLSFRSDSGHGEALSDDNLDWGEKLMRTLMTSTGTESNTSSGVSSLPSPTSCLRALCGLNGRRGFSSEDLMSLDADVCSFPRFNANVLLPLRRSPGVLRRAFSTSDLGVDIARFSCTKKLLWLLLTKRSDIVFPAADDTRTTVLDRSLSSCDLTEFERDMLRMQEEDATDAQVMNEDEPVPNGCRDALVEMDALGSLADLAVNAADEATEKTPTKVPSCPGNKAASDDENSELFTPQKRAALLEEIFASNSSSFTSEDSEDDGAATVQEWVRQLKTKKGAKSVRRAVVWYSPPGARPCILKRQLFERFGEQERSALASFDFLGDHSSSSSSSSCSEKPTKAATRNKSPSWRCAAAASASASSCASDDSYSSSLFLSDLCAVDQSLSSSSSLSFHQI